MVDPQTPQFVTEFWAVADELLCYPAWWTYRKVEIAMPELLLRDGQFGRGRVTGSGHPVEIRLETEEARIGVAVSLAGVDEFVRPDHTDFVASQAGTEVRWHAGSVTNETGAALVRFLLGRLAPASLTVTTVPVGRSAA